MKVQKSFLILLFLLLAIPIALGADFSITLDNLVDNQDLDCYSETVTVKGTLAGSGDNASGTIPCDLNYWDGGTLTKVGISTNITTGVNVTFNPRILDTAKGYTIGYNCTNNSDTANNSDIGQFGVNATGITAKCYTAGDIPSIFTNLLGTTGVAIIALVGLIVLVGVGIYCAKKFGYAK